MTLLPDQPRPRRRLNLNLTPMIDVVFLLLSFYILAGSFANEGRLLWPEAGIGPQSPSGQPPPTVLVNLSADNSLRLNGAPIDENDLYTRLGARVRGGEPLAMVLEIAETVPINRIVQVVDRTRDVGIDRVAILAP